MEEYLNKIICGDCLEVMKGIPSNSIDLVVTSPPYNIGIDYENWNDRMKWEDYWEFTKKWLTECFRILKEDGRICVNHYFSLGSGRIRIAPLMEIHKIAMEIGFKHHSVAVWQDITLSRITAWGSWLSASSPYINSPFEGILFMYKNKWEKNKKGITQISKREFIDLTRGIWKIPTEKKQLTKACFPIELPAKCIKLLSYENDLVLDPFAGSGTTGVACKNLNRNYILIEISEKYCEIAKQRINNLHPNLL